jgi:hypothetical protein
LEQNEHVQRVSFSGIAPEISNEILPQWQDPETDNEAPPYEEENVASRADRLRQKSSGTELARSSGHQACIDSR